MQTVDNTIVESTRQLTHKELVLLVLDLESRIVELEKSKTANKSDREMTDDDAKKVIASEKKHGDIAKEMGLSYGQVYSCRLGFTFKPIHKAMKEAGEKNRWIKD